MANSLVKQPGATLGWDAGATSVGSFDGSFLAVVTFVGGSDGVAVGLAPAGGAPLLAALEHAVQLIDGVFYILEKVGGQQSAVAVSPYPFGTDTQVSIARDGNDVTYTVGSWQYASTNPSSGTKQVDALLYAPGDAVQDPAFSAASPGDPYTADIQSRMLFASTFSSDDVLYAETTATLGLQFSFVTETTYSALIQASLSIAGSFEAGADITAEFSSSVRFTDAATAAAQALLQYATNLQTGAVGRYEGFDFSGFCNVGMVSYGWKSDGLYVIGGDTDQGTPMQAAVDFPAEDLNTGVHKRLTSIYLGLATDGQVFLRMVDDNERQVTYRALPRSNEYRADIQKKASSRYWRLRLELVDPTYATLDTVEWWLNTTGRRLTN